jgi:hypothetical protein
MQRQARSRPAYPSLEILPYSGVSKPSRQKIPSQVYSLHGHDNQGLQVGHRGSAVFEKPQAHGFVMELFSSADEIIHVEERCRMLGVELARYE